MRSSYGTAQPHRQFVDQRTIEQGEADWQLVTKLRNEFLAGKGTMEGWSLQKDRIIAAEQKRLLNVAQQGT